MTSISDALAHRQNQGRRRPRRRGARLALVAIVVVASAGAGGAFLWLRQDTGVYSDPEGTELPPDPADPPAVVSYLAGPTGQRLTAFVATVRPATEAGVAPSTCEDVVAELERGPAPAEVYAAAAGVPDPPTAELAVNHVDAVLRSLDDCLQGSPSPREPHFTGVLLDRRLGSFG